MHVNLLCNWVIVVVIILQVKKNKSNNRKRKDKNGQRQPKVSGYILFTKAYYKKKKKKNEELKPFTEESQSLKEAWKVLKDEENDKYRMRAKKLRTWCKGPKYVVPFHTRCALINL